MTESAAREEILARQLHEWYLEATSWLKRDGDAHGENYNPNACKNYDDLTKEQKFLDLYIAKKILSSRLVEMPSVEALAEFMEKRDKAVGFSYFYWDDAQAIVNFLKEEMK